ncbi:TonB-dependent receptor domain-containing protein [bacterium]
MKKIQFYLSFLLITAFSIINTPGSIRNGSVSGYILDKKTGLPIPDANILIQNTILGSASGDGGYFFIDNIPTGLYTITVKVIGYKTEILQNIAVEEKTSLNILLTPEVIKLNPIVVTGTGSDHLQHALSVSSEVFTSSDFRELNGHTAAEMIETSSGTYLKDYGGFAGIKSLSIRGSENSQVLVLLDGQRLNSSQDGTVDINTIPLEALERIEIIRGGHSAIYGTDAIGGTVQLITRESISPKGYSLGIRSTLGSFGTRGYSIWGSHRIGIFQYFINYNNLHSKGNFPYPDPADGKELFRANNDINENSLFIKSKIQISNKGFIKGIYQSLRSKRGAAGSIYWPSPEARRNENKHLISLHFQNQFTDRFLLKTKAYTQISDHIFEDPNGWPSNSHHENNTIGFDAQGRWTVLPNILINLGGEVRNDQVESTDVGTKDRMMKSIFIQSELDMPSIFSIPGNRIKWIPVLRWDHYSDAGSQVSPKIGMMIKCNKSNTLRIRGNIGQAFRVPTFNDLYWPEDMYTKGNPNLKAEVSTNWDIGFVYQVFFTGLFQWEMSYFKNDVQNLIQWQPASDWKWSPVNIGKSRITGIENSCTFRFPNNGAYLKASYTWMKAIDNTPGSEFRNNHLIYHPTLKFDVKTGIRIRDIQFNLIYRYVDKQYLDIENSMFRSHYQLLNGNAGLKLPIHRFELECKLQIFNILDKRFIIMEGYPVPGREIRISLGFTY